MDQSGGFNSVTLYPPKNSTSWVLARSSFFTAIGFALLRWQGWLSMWWFLVLAALGSMVELLPIQSFLRLDREGFTFRHGRRHDFVPWKIISHFFVDRGMYGTLPVRYEYLPEYQPNRTGSKFVRMKTKCDGGFLSTYGMTAEELAAYLNACLQAFRENHDQRPQAETHL